MTGTVLCDPDPEPAHTSRAHRARPADGGWRSSTRAGSAPASCCWARRRWRRSSPRAWGWSRWTSASPPSTCAGSRAGARRRSRRFCSTSDVSPASATSTPTRRCIRAGIHPLRPAGRLSRRAVRAPARGDDRGAAGRHRGARGDDRRLPPRRRRVGLLPGPVPGAPARGRAVRALRHDDREDGRRRAGNLRVRDLPAATSARGRRDAAQSGVKQRAARPGDRSRRRPELSAKPPSSCSPTITWGRSSSRSAVPAPRGPRGPSTG